MRCAEVHANHRDSVVILIYGYDGSGPGHWQRWLAAELRQQGVPVLFPELPDPTAPRKDAWVSALADTVAMARGAPITFVCHSLGCWAVDHLLAERCVAGARAALLVAPPSPFLLFEPVDSFLPPPRRADAWSPLAPHILVVGSDNDDLTAPEEFEGIARALGGRCSIIAGAGHVNVASGYGPWPFALEWLGTVGAI